MNCFFYKPAVNSIHGFLGDEEKNKRKEMSTALAILEKETKRTQINMRALKLLRIPAEIQTISS